MNYQINQRVRITYRGTGVVVTGIIKGFASNDTLIVDRDGKGLGQVPINHWNVKIEVM